jgi:hypothetical protein
MRKIFLFQLVFGFYSMLCFGQKATSVAVSTTTSLKEALHICKIEGEVNGFFSDDYGDEPDAFTMQGHILGHIIKIEIDASHPNDTTKLVLKIHLVPGMMGLGKLLRNYVNDLKSKLENVETGKYEDIKE